MNSGDCEDNNMITIPVYLITGFLESGKTTFMQDVLSSPDFADGSRTLLLLCEEGETEYDKEDYLRHNIEIETVGDESQLTPQNLEALQKKHKPERVFIEFNGMWDSQKFASGSMPKKWELVQVITLVDGSTFEVYLNNMRMLMSNIFRLTELVIFNRCTPDMDLQKFRRAVKAVNQQAMVDFEDADGNPIDIGKMKPPYDIDADVIDITDVDWGLWYLDMTDNPDRYKGKTVKFTAKVMIPKKFPDGLFIPGRNAMTCCANDIRFIGYVCKSKYVSRLKQKQWLEVTAVVKYEYSEAYKGEGPVLYSTHLKSVGEPEDELVYFN